MMIFYHAIFTFNGLLEVRASRDKNYSLTLNHVPLFLPLLFSNFLIFKYDLYYLLENVKICFF